MTKQTQATTAADALDAARYAYRVACAAAREAGDALDAARDALDAAIADDFDDAAADRDAARDAYRADAAYRAEVVKA